MKKFKPVLDGEKHSPLFSSLATFEHFSMEYWPRVVTAKKLKPGDFFLVGALKYDEDFDLSDFRFSKNRLFVQSNYSYEGSSLFAPRNYGAFYSFYQPDVLPYEDDIVFEESAVYQLLPDKRVRLVLGNLEHLKRDCIDKMFQLICEEFRVLPSMFPSSLPYLSHVRFRKSVGYFIKNREYDIWAKRVGLWNEDHSDLTTGWICCDINCGVPVIVKDKNDFFICPQMYEDSKIGLFKYENGDLVF